MNKVIVKGGGHLNKEDTYICPFCHIRFRLKYSLKKHLDNCPEETAQSFDKQFNLNKLIVQKWIMYGNKKKEEKNE